MFKRRYDVAAQGCTDFFWCDFGAVNVSCDEHVALAISAVDGGITSSNGKIGDGVERHLGAIRRADVHVFEVADGLSFLLWKTNHDAHIVLASRDPLSLGAVEGGPHLGRQVVERQSKVSRLGQQIELNFLFARAPRIRDVEHALEF